MAYGVIIYESEHDSFMDMPDETVGKIVKNMIRAFRGEEYQVVEEQKPYSLSLYNRVAGDKGKLVDKVINGSKGGAPKGNQNAKKTTETTTQNNLNNIKEKKIKEKKEKENKEYNYPPNQFTFGIVKADIDFDELEKRKVKN